MVSDYDFSFEGLMNSSMQSIPIGNGDLGANVWAKDGAIYLLLSKTDAFSELHRLLKTGYLKLKFSQGIIDSGLTFRLSVEKGILYIENSKVKLQIRADAIAPVYKINIKFKRKSGCKLTVINYRNTDIELENNDRSVYQLNCESGVNTGFGCVECADVVFSLDENCIGQYHHNKKSLYEFSLAHQGLENFTEKNDALSFLAFGFLAKSEQMTVSDGALSTNEELQEINIDIHSLSLQCKNIEEWKDKILKFPKSDKNRHIDYWRSVWKKSYIYASGTASAQKMTEGYIYQRYMNLCAGKGQYPIKFNGSIFTCQPSPHFKNENYDYRNWGGYYWLQNTRLIYWSMLFSGDYETMLPFFHLYIDNLSLAKFRTKEYFNHEGAFYPETMSIFAAYADCNYGWSRDGKHKSLIDNNYIRWYYCGALEVAYMMLRYCDFTNDDSFLQKCIPFIRETLLFYKAHFPTESGVMVIKPTASLETWQDCINDTPTIIGLGAICEWIKNHDSVSSELCELCDNILNRLPDVPLEKRRNKTIIAPCEKKLDTHKLNCENPELYSVFPFEYYRVGKDGLQIVINTYKSRQEKASNGWQQHAVQAAKLGLKKDAIREIIRNYRNTNKKCIFPSFYGPNYDWLPDQDNGNVANAALAQSLVQADDECIYVLPAWKKNMNVEFRLPISGNFITVSYKRGHKPEINFDKPERRRIIVF